MFFVNALGEKNYAPVPLLPPQILQGLVWIRTRSLWWQAGACRLIHGMVTRRRKRRGSRRRRKGRGKQEK